MLWEANVTSLYRRAVSAPLVLAYTLQIQIPGGAASLLHAGVWEAADPCLPPTARTRQTAARHGAVLLSAFPRK